MSVDHYENSSALNEFLDTLSDFVDSFKDSDGSSNAYAMVAEYIKEELIRDRELPVDDPNHPFQKYATDSKAENIRNLARTTMGRCQQNPELRSAVHSFFHSGGACRDELDELIEEYYRFADFIMDDGEDDYETEEEEGDDEPQQHNVRVPRLQGGPFTERVAAW